MNESITHTAYFSNEAIPKTNFLNELKSLNHAVRPCTLYYVVNMKKYYMYKVLTVIIQLAYDPLISTSDTSHTLWKKKTSLTNLGIPTAIIGLF